MTIHVKTKPEDLAPIVIVPGDPDRSEYVAHKFLKDVKCTTDYRKMYGFTGTYNGRRISVQTTGMGGPSAAIVLEELCNLGAKLIVRIGTCGALQTGIALTSTLIAQGSYNCDATPEQIFGSPAICAMPDFDFLEHCRDVALEDNVPFKIGPIASMDLFYDDRQVLIDRLHQFGVLAVEMESATLFTIAAKRGIRSGTLLTVSDIVNPHQRASEQDILNGVDRMTQTALRAACRFTTDEI